MKVDGIITFIGRVIERKDQYSIIKIHDHFRKGIMGLEKFSHVIVLYWFHLNDNVEKRSILEVHPRGNPLNPLVGVFASRSPSRPNPIGLCVCKINYMNFDKGILCVQNLDALVESPIVDIKPYIPSLDAYPCAQVPVWAKGDRK